MIFFMQERVVWIDQIKGVAILLVVIGHILWFPMGFADIHINGCLLLNFVYSFHMPLFIFLSGMVIHSVPNVRKFNHSNWWWASQDAHPKIAKLTRLSVVF